MKFVTVMDMWLLIINVVMLIGIAYGGRRLIKTVEQIASKDSDAIIKERKAVLAIVQKEIEHMEQVISMSDKMSPDFQHLIDTNEILIGIRSDIIKRETK